MPDRRPPNSGSDDYDWLYDNGQSDAQKSTSRPPARSSASDLPPPNLPPPSGRARARNDQRRPSAPAGTRGPTTSAKAGRRSRFRWLKAVLALWLVFLVAVPIWAWTQIARVDAEPEDERPADQPGTTYLLVGSDSRAGLTAEQRKELTTGADGGGRGRTDTILMLHVGDGPSVLTSIPRDSLVPIPGVGRTKINAAYAYGGPKLLVKTLEQSTGVRIDNYVEIGFGGLVNIVDAVGGVELCPKQDLKDRDSGLNISQGCQDVDGPTALAYARNRHSYANQDLQRVQNQREVIGAIGNRVRSPWTVLNPVRYVRTASGGAKSLTIGENVGPVALARFAISLSGVMGGNGLNCTVPLADTSVRWDRERALQFFEKIKTDRTSELGSLCTSTGFRSR